MTTKEHLAQRLEELGAHGLAVNARLGMYSDFESEVDAPKVLLMADLRALSRHAGSQGDAGLDKMIREVMDGKWDDTPEEAEAWAAAQTGEMREMIDRLLES